MGGDSTTDIDPVSHYEQYVTAWNDHDFGRVMSLFAPEVTYFDPATGEPLGRDDLRPFFEEVVEGFPDVRFEVRRILGTDAEGVVVVEWTMHGTHSGTYEGLPPTGETVELDGMERAEITSEGIREVRGYFNESEFVAQLGLDFPAVIGKLPRLAAGKARDAL